MTLTRARKLREEIRQTRHIHCVVPMSGKEAGPSRFACRISGPTDFRSRREWLAYRRGVDERHKRSIEAATEIERAGGVEAWLRRNAAAIRY